MYDYDCYVEKYGITERQVPPSWREGTFITPSGTLFDVNGYVSVAHGGGFVLPFVKKFLEPDEKMLRFYSKDEILKILYEWKKALLTRSFDTNPKDQMMRYHLVLYLINIFRSSRTIWDPIKEVVDISYATGLNSDYRKHLSEDRHLKDIYVQACNYDAIESQQYRTITTSKFNIYETFYPYIMNDWKIIQIPKKVYNEKEERYVEYKQSPFLISDRELRLKDELYSICKNYSLEERHPFLRQREFNRYDFIN